MKHKRTITMAALAFVLLLGLVTQVLGAGPLPLLRLPTHTVRALHDAGTLGTYFDVVFQGVGAGFDVQDRKGSGSIVIVNLECNVSSIPGRPER